jgi:hypothetical protein
LTAEPLAFDSAKQQITPKHILATTGYPTYYFQWVEVEKGVYAWHGSLLSNTPLREVIDASPVNDKRIFLVENYPKNTDKLPDNILEVQHRARDIMFSDKTFHNIQMAKAITYHLKFIDELYHAIENRFDLQNKEDRKIFEKIQAKYRHGGQIVRARSDRSLCYFTIVSYHRDRIGFGICYVNFIQEFINCYCHGVHSYTYNLYISGITINYRDRTRITVCYSNFICIFINFYI